MTSDDSPDRPNDGVMSVESNELTHALQPTSARRVVRGIFLLLGVGVLVPWNAFISAKSYFDSRICSDEGSASGSSINIESTFSMVYNLASVISLALIIAIQALRDQLLVPESHAPVVASTDIYSSIGVLENDPLNETISVAEQSGSSNESHSFWLVMIPLSFYVAAFVVQTCMVFVAHIPFFLQWTILSLAVCGMACGIAQAGIVATAGAYQADLAMNPYLAGQSVGGVAVSFVNFIAACWENPTDFITAHCGDTLKASTIALDVRRILISEQKSSSCFPYRKVDWSVFLYFFLGSLLLVACLIGYSFIDRFGDSVERRDDYETVRSIDGSMPDSSPRIGLELHGAKSRNNEVQVSDGLRVTAVADRQDEASSEADALFNDHDPANETAAVWRHVRGPATCIFLTFLVTLSLFPGWISDLRSVRQCKTKFRLANDLYIPFVFLLFNIGDLTGRLLLARVPLEQIRNLPTKLVAASSIRLLFFPVLFLCNGGSRLNRTYIHSDIYSLTVQFAFAVSNGFLLSASFVHAPSLIPNTSHTQERMSEILSFAVAFGLLCGSLLSFPVSSFVGR